MYSMLKKIITEKDIYRQILLLEQLLNHSQLTAKELAEKIGTTERTVFSDLQLIRDYLPAQWELDSDKSGIRLVSQEYSLTNDIWEAFLPHSVSLQLIKQLFFTKELNIPHFLDETGVSYETLKRQRTKINRQLLPFKLKIRLTATHAYLLGEESAIRIFYHRLLLPFTHNNYFFENYSIHEEHYLRFLTKELTADLYVDTEQIFGICWFFINSIRIKAGCPINDFSFDTSDPLFALYAPLLKDLYRREGVYLQDEEIFFAFFCFIESWNYNNPLGKKVSTVLAEGYPLLLTKVQQTVQEIADELALPTLPQTNLATNLVLLVLKYLESPALSEQFQLEYQELLHQRNEKYTLLTDKSIELFTSLPQFSMIRDTTYFVNLFSLLSQQAIFATRPQTKTVFLVFQSEPAWKAFLQQELADFLGKRVNLVSLEASQLQPERMQTGDLIVSNIPLDVPPIPVIYISTIPTKNELSQLAELTSHSYL
ncbi:helix-turn-helix domain-containing protein [Enterococcus raffinosus]|uniref:helix-turn-helix domain-containing protein n=1 Tax=Enterococcus raffinosus TaxID=71452 RepID=UPI001C0F9052|nr:helix-turn-helix domain-containing protein [Enterococcus raffinosus]MBU5359797.1 helix-turn-helix domain-containing protein [Enterococcus raffinosus]